ncbi:MAG: ROK family protein [Phaeodactylibacter sp.]|nr:ROK family protein [Phaeodactylibacter sp.]MCB9276183.1 ROK family protein [Lewinellaceae bacterium]
MKRTLIPITFPQKDPLPEGVSLLATDVGGTKADMALFVLEDGLPVLKEEHRYASSQWDSLIDMARDFCKGSTLPKRMSISFAGPVKQGRAQGTNLPWDIDSHALRQALGMESVSLINDLEANCYGLAALQEEDVKVIHPGEIAEPGNSAVISPGTGLGEGGLFWDGEAYRPFATEGGHAHFAPRDELDWRLFTYLAEQYGHVSWERVVSGMGITNIFRFLKDVERMEVPASLEHIEAPAISRAAEAGNAISQRALQLFFRYLAWEAANLVMKFKATGGIYIGGGIVPKIWNEAYCDIFNEQFFVVGRLASLVRAAPVTLILNQKTALLGAGWYGAFR